MRLSKKNRQALLKELIYSTPFITDEQLASEFDVSIQTIRLDRLELGIPELRERIKDVATQSLQDKVKSLPIEEVIGEIIDIEPDDRAISILNIKEEHVFSRKPIARGHHLFAQANSLAVALIDDELALTHHSEVSFNRQVKLGEQVVCKATVLKNDGSTTFVKVESYVKEELVFLGVFEMFRSKEKEQV